MIKAKELRIGNYLYNPIQKINFKVDLVAISNVINDIRLDRPKELKYQGIQLTEDILLKCGFFWREDTSCFSYCNEGDKIYSLPLDIDENIIYISFGRDSMICNDTGGLVYIYSLHQLQNIYFALTNKELDIKL